MKDRRLSPREVRKILEEQEGQIPMNHSQRLCSHCNSLLAPYIDRGRIRYECFDCTSPSLQQ